MSTSDFRQGRASSDAAPSAEGSAQRKLELLASAIAAAAQKAGIYNGEVPLAGPHLLQLLDDLARGPCAAPNVTKCLPDGIRYKLAPLVLSGRQLADALDFVAPDREADQLEQCVCIAERDNVKNDDGETMMPPGLFVWLEEYPEEGCLPLDDVLPQAHGLDGSPASQGQSQVNKETP